MSLQARPYIFTKVNSQSHPEVPTTTTTTTATTDASTSSSTTSSASPPPMQKCPPSLPVWVPVVVGLGCFLAGLVISLKILHCYRCHKRKSGQEVETKEIKF